MSIPDWSNSIYGFFFVTTAVGLGAWRVFQHGVHTSIEKHLEELESRLNAQLEPLTEAMQQIDKRTDRIEYALYNDGKTGLINKVDALMENQQKIKTDVAVLKSKRGNNGAKS